MTLIRSAARASAMLAVLAIGALQGCQHAGRREPFAGKSEAPCKVTQRTDGFTRTETGSYVPNRNPKVANIEVVSNADEAGGALWLQYAIMSGTSADCPFPQGTHGWWWYVRGAAWPRQRTRWIEAGCDGTNAIIQVIINDATGVETDRVILLDDGRPSGQPPSIVTATLISDQSFVQLVCDMHAAPVKPECYTESVNGAPLLAPTPLPSAAPTTAGDAGVSDPIRQFVDCVKRKAEATNLAKAVPPPPTGPRQR